MSLFRSLNATIVLAFGFLANSFTCIGQPNGTTFLNVFFHSNTATIRDVEEVRATADKLGGFAEMHTFFRCYSPTRAAWCELTIGKPRIAEK